MAEADSDAAFAARLQAEEFRAAGRSAGPVSYQATPAQPLPQRTQDPHAAVRQTMIREQARVAAYRSRTHPKYAAALSWVQALGYASGCVAVYAMEGSAVTDCDGPLYSLAWAWTVRTILNALLFSIMARYHGQNSAIARSRLSALFQRQDVLGCAGAVLFIVLQVYTYRSDTCVSSVWHLALGMVIAEYTVMLLPCVILVLSLPALCLCLPLYVRLVSRMAAPPVGGAGGATREQLHSLPSRRYQENMFGTDPDDNKCPITQEQYKEGDSVTVLPCGHHFSQSAIESWLARRNTCPICRAPAASSADGATARTPLIPERSETADEQV